MLIVIYYENTRYTLQVNPIPNELLVSYVVCGDLVGGTVNWGVNNGDRVTRLLSQTLVR